MTSEEANVACLTSDFLDRLGLMEIKNRALKGTVFLLLNSVQYHSTVMAVELVDAPFPFASGSFLAYHFKGVSRVQSFASE